MGQWQSKFLFSVVLYGAGFVTAVYFLAPDPASASEKIQPTDRISRLQPAQAVVADAGIDSKVWAAKIRTGIDTTIHFAEEHALQVAGLIQSKIAQGGSKPNSQTVVE